MKKSAAVPSGAAEKRGLREFIDCWLLLAPSDDVKPCRCRCSAAQKKEAAAAPEERPPPKLRVTPASTSRHAPRAAFANHGRARISADPKRSVWLECQSC